MPKLAASALNNDKLPVKEMLLASLLPILVVLFFGIFVSRPVLSHDLMTGLHAWLNFIEGGAWHSLSVPDPSNISQNIEEPISWWTPGLYLPMGLLSTLGLSYQSAAMVIFVVFALSLGWGSALLAKALGSPTKALPWIVLASICSQNLFSAFSAFSGGDIGLYAIFPWIALAAWRLRKEKYLVIAILPPLFLLGTFIKHSFAIYAVSIVALLSSESLEAKSRKLQVLEFIRRNIPLLLVFLFYLLGRHFLFTQGPTPADSTSNLQRDFPLLWGFNAFAPLIGTSSLQHFLTMALPSTGSWESFSLDGKEWPFTLLSPCPLILYTWLLMKGDSPLSRFSGITSLVAFSVLFIAMWRGGAISLETRHYQPAALLLLLSLVTQAFTRSEKISLIIKYTIILFISWAFIGLFDVHLTRHRSASNFHKKYQYLHADAPASVIEELKRVATLDTSSLIFLSEIGLGLELHQYLHPSSRFAFNPFSTTEEYYGRVPRLVFAMPDNRVTKGDAIAFRDSFKDYSADEWESYSIDGWQIWFAGPSKPEVESGT